MKQYTFFDRNYYSNSGIFFIAGEHYRILLRKCFKYGMYLSLKVYDETAPFIKELDTWKVHDLSEVSDFIQPTQYRLYFANTDVYNLFLKKTTSILEYRCWSVNMPYEDVSFIRKDGSIFFSSIFHEGECSIYPCNDEDVSDILKQGHWLPINKDGVPEIFARECQLPLPSLDEVLLDPMYISLRKIQQSPNSLTSIYTIESISSFVDSYRPKGWTKAPDSIERHLSFFPRWFIGFKFYLLGKCDATTTTSITEALVVAGYPERAGFVKFFEFLDEYLSIVKSGQGRRDGLREP